MAGSSHSEVDFPWLACFGVEGVVCFDCPTSIHVTSLLSVSSSELVTGILLSHWTWFGGLRIKVPCPLLARELLEREYGLCLQLLWGWLTLQPFLNLQGAC